MARPSKFDARSEEIMAAFEVCVARQGLAGTTLADVAAEAKLPRSLVRYFMGNRDEMVDRLVERIMSRAETGLAQIRDEAGVADLDGLLDLLFSEVLADDLFNAVMGELWHTAARDEHVRSRLMGFYDHALSLTVQAMEKAQVGADGPERRTIAYAVLSIVLGQSSLADFGLRPDNRGAMRQMAGQIVARAKVAAT